MEFQRSGAERRRRVLMEDHDSPTDETSTAVAGPRRKTGPGNRANAKTSYAEDAQADRQPRITDLIPKRVWTLSVLTLSGLTLVFGVLCLYTHVFQRRERLSATDLGALDLNAPASLATWLASAMLAAAAGGAVIVYMVRRHKQDDYRGHYRWWLWTAAVLLLASVDATAGLHRVLPPLLRQVTGKTLYGDGSIWWMAIAGSILSILVVRIALEIRRCRASLGVLMLAIAGYLTAAAIAVGTVRWIEPGLSAMAWSSCLLLAHLSVGLSVALYARYVFLDAHGKLPAATARPKKERVKKPDAAEKDASSPEPNPGAADKDDTTLRIDPAHEAPLRKRKPEPEPTPRPAQPASQAPVATPSKKPPLFFKPTQSEETDEDSDDGRGRPLSKAERKRLRKERREPVAD